MATRRGFLKAAGATGIAFCSCCLLDAARAQGAAPARLPVLVGGQAGQDRRCPRPLPLRRGAGPDGQRTRRRCCRRPRACPSTSWAWKAGSRRWTTWPSTWRSCRSTRSGMVRTGTPPRRSSPSTTRSSPSCAPPIPTGSAPSPRSRCSIPTWRFSSSRMRSQEGAARGGDRRQRARRQLLQPALPPVLAKAEELGAVLFIHPQGTPELAKRSPATVGWRTRSAIPWKPPSRSST